MGKSATDANMRTIKKFHDLNVRVNHWAIQKGIHTWVDICIENYGRPSKCIL